MKLRIFTFILFIICSLPAYSQIGSLKGQPIFHESGRKDLWVRWEYEGIEYVIAYSDIPEEEYKKTLSTDNSGNYSVIIRGMQVYKKKQHGWIPASTSFFQSSQIFKNELDFTDYPKESGGSAKVFTLHDGYVLITQRVRLRIFSNSYFFPVFLLLKKETREGYMDWSVELEYLPNIKSGVHATSIELITQHHYKVNMSDKTQVDLHFNHNGYTVALIDESGNYVYRK